MSYDTFPPDIGPANSLSIVSDVLFDNNLEIQKVFNSLSCIFDLDISDVKISVTNLNYTIPSPQARTILVC